eukprot:gnl/TRDRNA2_/TRDRNA2_175893_c0_seq11.p2 gnl/TRDRNA2_/TRDRNA2_175893_c0~~gnl/TRDRNA2_/TRDRNA2_175893_c0_seq11.p2  ORF type:complete len:129 (+),score=21.32 gnl/TRDRNA2_/TRDRNA2_175893_c0_seq11:98-484(+)
MARVFLLSLLVLGAAALKTSQPGGADAMKVPCSGIECGDMACPEPFELKTMSGQCCPICWAPDHVVPLDRHKKLDPPSPYLVDIAEGAPSTCKAPSPHPAKCFKPVCKVGFKEGYVSGNCCNSCVPGL